MENERGFQGGIGNNTNLNSTPNSIPNNLTDKPEQPKEYPQNKILENSVDSNIENIRKDIKDDITEENSNSKTSSDQNIGDTSAYVSPEDLQITKSIEDILDGDLLQVYESLDAAGQEKYNKTKSEASAKVLLAIKSATGNIKKVIKVIFNIISGWMSSLGNISNRAFIEKETKLKVERIIREYNENKYNSL